ncbi:hypothetical protein OC842_005719 [Tilletia horrida]|uniref:Polysaccharide lyase 14 domain-containing protein n=1 Tax=Tilletia horrida TaxID=155126 RepID=A0AAN6G7A0_9BASI|nr:hypothetical protein OC842_005719 [Tilletia horrida]
MVRHSLTLLAMAATFDFGLAAGPSGAQLISSQPRSVSESRHLGWRRRARDLLRSVEFVDLRHTVPPVPQAEQGMVDTQLNAVPPSAWTARELDSIFNQGSPPMQGRSIANTTFLIASTEDIAAEYECVQEPWMWAFQPSPDLVPSSNATLSATTTTTFTAALLLPSALATDSASLVEPSPTSLMLGNLAAHVLVAHTSAETSSTSTLSAAIAVPSASSDNGPPLLSPSDTGSPASAPTSGTLPQNVSPLRRKLSTTRPRALQPYDEDMEAEAFFPATWHDHERRDSKANYAVAKDEPTLDWLSSNLNLYQGKVSVGDNNLRLAPDPLAAAGTNQDTILSVFYPQGSYAPSKSDPVGGASFYAQPFLGPNNAAQQRNVNDSTQVHYRSTLVLQYSVAFPLNFDFVKGGKLPGLYSSVGLPSNGSNDIPLGDLDANTDGCSGGARDGVGLSCWSARIMWRQGGIGEVYAYFPTDKIGQYDPCRTRASTMICNDEYGTSIGRGSFSFVPGQYTNLTLVVSLNSAPSVANGELSLWVDGQQVIDEPNMLWRTGTIGVRATGRGGGSGAEAFRVLKAKLERPDAHTAGGVEPVPASKRQEPADDASMSQEGAAWVDKVFFSTFFGGSTSDYAASKDEEAYFKDFSLYSSTRLSAAPGLNASPSSSSSPRTGPDLALGVSMSVVVLVALSVLHL